MSIIQQVVDERKKQSVDTTKFTTPTKPEPFSSFKQPVSKAPPPPSRPAGKVIQTGATGGNIIVPEKDTLPEQESEARQELARQQAELARVQSEEARQAEIKALEQQRRQEFSRMSAEQQAQTLGIPLAQYLSRGYSLDFSISQEKQTEYFAERESIAKTNIASLTGFLGEVQAYKKERKKAFADTVGQIEFFTQKLKLKSPEYTMFQVRKESKKFSLFDEPTAFETERLSVAGESIKPQKAEKLFEFAPFGDIGLGRQKVEVESLFQSGDLGTASSRKALIESQPTKLTPSHQTQEYINLVSPIEKELIRQEKTKGSRRIGEFLILKGAGFGLGSVLPISSTPSITTQILQGAGFGIMVQMGKERVGDFVTTIKSDIPTTTKQRELKGLLEESSTDILRIYALGSGIKAGRASKLSKMDVLYDVGTKSSTKSFMVVGEGQGDLQFAKTPLSEFDKRILSGTYARISKGQLKMSAKEIESITRQMFDAQPQKVASFKTAFSPDYTPDALRGIGTSQMSFGGGYFETASTTPPIKDVRPFEIVGFFDKGQLITFPSTTFKITSPKYAFQKLFDSKKGVSSATSFFPQTSTTPVMDSVVKTGSISSLLATTTPVSKLSSVSLLALLPSQLTTEVAKVRTEKSTRTITSPFFSAETPASSLITPLITSQQKIKIASTPDYFSTIFSASTPVTTPTTSPTTSTTAFFSASSFQQDIPPPITPTGFEFGIIDIPPPFFPFWKPDLNLGAISKAQKRASKKLGINFKYLTSLAINIFPEARQQAITKKQKKLIFGWELRK